jgi:hypothetical protein
MVLFTNWSSQGRPKATHATSRHLTPDYLLLFCGMIMSHGITNRNGCITCDAWSQHTDWITTEAYVHTATQGFTNNKKKYGVQNFKYAQLCFLFFLSNKRVETYGRLLWSNRRGGTKTIRKQGKTFSRDESHFYAIVLLLPSQTGTDSWKQEHVPMCLLKRNQSSLQNEKRNKREDGSSRHQNGEQMESFPS